MHKSHNTSLEPVFLNYDNEGSPFISQNSRNWGRFLDLKNAIIAAILLFLAFICTFISPHLLNAQYFLLLFVYFLVGVPALIETVEAILHLHIDLDVLMTLSAFAAVLIGNPMEGALLLVLFSLSEAIEEAVQTKAQGALKTLYKITPTKAFVVKDDGNLIERSVKDIPLHAHIFVKAGEVIPLDGEVIEGVSEINLAHLTGEQLPVTKTVGEEVPAGAYTIQGSLKIKVTRTNSDSTLSNLIRLITKAQEAKPQLQKFFEKFLQYYSITIIFITIAFAIFLPYITSIPYQGQTGSIYRALAFMIAASPCALVIAMPIAYLSAISSAARKGILIKGGGILDAIASCKAIAFDKTGTLTTGNFQVANITHISDGIENSDLNLDILQEIAASLEVHSKHPIALTIVKQSSIKAKGSFSLETAKSYPGLGVEGEVIINKLETTAKIGHFTFVKDMIPLSILEKTKTVLELAEKRGHVVAILCVSQEVLVYELSDSIRAGISQALQNLKQRFKLQLYLLTGDHTRNAERVAKEVGIENCYSNLTPEDKFHKVTELSSEQHLIMIGDGVNDAPALARATVGISMGEVGSATAIQASDVVLLKDDLNHLEWLINRAKKTQKIVLQNVAFAAGIILLASLSALFGNIPLWLAVLLHEGGTILVGLNGLRLLRK